MIERMKRVDFLMSINDSEIFLDDLQALGLVHICSQSLADDDGLLSLEKRITAFENTIAALHKYHTSSAETLILDESIIMDAEVFQEKVHTSLEMLGKLETERDEHRHNLDILAHWGNFDSSEMRAIEDAGVRISFHVASKKQFLHVDISDRYIELISEKLSKLLFVEFIPSDFSEREPLFPPENFPRIGVDRLKEKLEKCISQINEIEQKLHILALNAQILEDSIRELKREHERRMASLSLGSAPEGSICFLSGYIPVSSLSQIQNFLEQRSILPVFSEPDKSETTPVLLRNNSVTRLFEPITRIFGLPQYVEIDTTPFFAPFFAFFFGICLADVGYGVLLFLASLVGLFVLKKHTLRLFAMLGFILGCSTIIGGVLLNTIFGVKLDILPRIPEEIRTLILFKDLNDAMVFSIFLGVLQISLGFTLQVVNKIRQDGFVAALFPIGTFLFLLGSLVMGINSFFGTDFSIGPMKVGLWVNFFGRGSMVGIMMLCVGIALIMLFNNHRKSIWIRPVLGILEMYGIASGLLGDILSYIRLFALALAGALLGGAINLIAMMVRGEQPNFFSWIFMILILLGGHSINFALAALGAFVHPLRLTFVEFYKAVGFSGGGYPYTPYGGKI